MTIDVATDVEGIPHTDFSRMREIANELIDTCVKKDREYSNSWCRRGGVGAFFTVWRKADRMEAQLKKNGYNIFDVTGDPSATESLDETIKDFVAYLLLVLEKRDAVRWASRVAANQLPVSEDEDEPTLGYVNQDR